MDAIEDSYFLHQDMASPFPSNPHRPRLHSNRWLPGYHHIGVSVTPAQAAPIGAQWQCILNSTSRTMGNEFEGSENDLPVNTFQLAYLSSTEDLYIVYNKPHTPPNCAVQILEGPEETPLDFIVRSFEGYPKEGVILFGYPSFCGMGQSFPVSSHDIATTSTASSMIVTRGKWKLYSSVHHCGSPLAIKGKTTFEAGQMYPTMSFDGAVVKSLKRVG